MNGHRLSMLSSRHFLLPVILVAMLLMAMARAIPAGPAVVNAGNLLSMTHAPMVFER